MKVNELYSAVCKLGFESTLEDIPAFFIAANRAMLQINALRPLTSIMEIYHRGLKNLIAGADHNIKEHLSEDVIYTSNGAAKSYYFEVKGEGECKVEIYNKARKKWENKENITFNTMVFTAFKNLIKPDGEYSSDPARLRFIGDYVFQIKNVALYEHIYSEAAEDIPAFTEYARYDMRELDPRFIELADKPMVGAYTRLNEGYIFEEESVLLLPSDVARDLKIKYKRTPNEIDYRDNPTLDDTRIDLDPELVQLLPLLTAVFVLADEGDGKSEYYLTLYRERAAEIEARKRSRKGAGYISVDGW